MESFERHWAAPLPASTEGQRYIFFCSHHCVTSRRDVHQPTTVGGPLFCVKRSPFKFRYHGADIDGKSAVACKYDNLDTFEIFLFSPTVGKIELAMNLTPVEAWSTPTDVKWLCVQMCLRGTIMSCSYVLPTQGGHLMYKFPLHKLPDTVHGQSALSHDLYP